MMGLAKERKVPAAASDSGNQARQRGAYASHTGLTRVKHPDKSLHVNVHISNKLCVTYY